MSNFDKVLSHLGHELEVAVYGDNENVAIECLTCMEVVVDYNQSECRYCGGECETSDEYMCDGYAGDIDNLYAEENDNGR